MITTNALTWSITVLATAGVIVRPFGWPEAIWAVAGAVCLVLFGLLPPEMAWTGIAKGYDVYFFLIGMMLLSELARREGLFDWIAALATRKAKGSPTRLFFLVYAIGTIVTVFLSNDATAVVLTPAVYAATKAAKVDEPLPYLIICAFIANAASFVLPISNPANLVVFGGGHMPPLMQWLKTFALPSTVSIASTYLALWMTQRGVLAKETITCDVKQPQLSMNGKAAAGGIILTAFALIIASFLGVDLGIPTFAAGIATGCFIFVKKRENPLEVAKEISWGILPLVAGLFVLVEALDRTGVIRTLSELLKQAAATRANETAAGTGILIAVASNLINNLPAGLVAGSAVTMADMPKSVTSAILIGVDLGPNLSVTGSLATILWLTAIRREGENVGAWCFLKIGLIVMPAALLPTIAALLLLS